MEPFDTLRQRVRQAKAGLIHRQIGKIIQQEEARIIDYNTQDQLFEKGINSLGVKIASFDPYSQVTVEIKEQKGQPFDRVTLLDEGDFYAGWFIKIFPDRIEFGSADPKEVDLIERYGEDIFGLTQENLMDFIINIMRPELQVWYKNFILNGKL